MNSEHEILRHAFLQGYAAVFSSELITEQRHPEAADVLQRHFESME